MKHVLSLLALILAPAFAVSAWADADDHPAAAPAAATQPAAPAAAAQAASKAATPWASIEGLAVNIELKGSHKNVAAMIARMEQEPIYKEAACAKGKKAGSITCEHTNSGIIMLVSQPYADVTWTMSGATLHKLFTGKNPPKMQTLSLTTCTVSGCTYMQCPPGSAYACCHFVNGAWTTVGC